MVFTFSKLFCALYLIQLPLCSAEEDNTDIIWLSAGKYGKLDHSN
jgi:hypothetical protein